MVNRTDVEWNQNIVKFDNQRNEKEVTIEESDEVEIKLTWFYETTVPIEGELEILKKLLFIEAYHYVLDFQEETVNGTIIEPKNCSHSLSNYYKQEAFGI